MPSISIPTAVAAAGVGAAGAIGSSLISSNAASSASSAQQQSSQQALALQQSEYNQTVQNEAPYLQSGDAALSQLDTLYGLSAPAASAATTGYSPTATTTTSPMVVGAGKNNAFSGISEGGITQAQANSILSSRPDVQNVYNNLPSNTKASFGSPQAYAAYWYNSPNGKAAGYQLPNTNVTTTAAPTSQTYTNAAGGQSTANPDASFYLSPDYNFALQQGLQGVQASAAANGLGDSGAARKAEIAYASGLGSQQFQNYATTLKSIAAGGQAAASNQTTAGNSYGQLGTYTLNNAGNNAAGSAGAQGTIGTNLTTSLAGSLQSYLNNQATASSYLTPSYSAAVPSDLQGLV